jgi:hypothetical protein
MWNGPVPAREVPPSAVDILLSAHTLLVGSVTTLGKAREPCKFKWLRNFWGFVDPRIFCSQRQLETLLTAVRPIYSAHSAL